MELNFKQEDYLRTFLALLPSGRIWNKDLSSPMAQAINSLMPTISRLSDRAVNLLTDSFIGTTGELLPEWERTLGLPDPCQGQGATVALRRAQAVQRFIGGGGQSVPFFTDLLAALGYTVTITEGSSFRAGISRAGDPVGSAYAYAWTVNAPTVTVFPFKAGQGRAGEALNTWGDEVLECVINELKPSHTTALFAYGGVLSPPASDNFTVVSGKFYDPDGNLFVPAGMNIADDQVAIAVTNGAAQPLTTLFPGINYVRLNCYPSSGVGTASAVYGSVASLSSYITQLTANKIVVCIEDHSSLGGQWADWIPGGIGGTNSAPPVGSALATELAWYQSLATAFVGNPYVWFGSLNEINSADGTYSTSAIGAVSTYQLALYNAIRATGNNNVIMMGAGLGGSNPGTVGLGSGFIAANYSAMTNIGWYLHAYYDNGTNAGALASLQGSTFSAGSGGGGGSGYIGAQTITSADGTVPVIFDEWGSATGTSTTTIASSMVYAIGSVQSLGIGSAAWTWAGNSNTDPWVAVNNAYLPALGTLTLTTWGTEIAAVIA